MLSWKRNSFLLMFSQQQQQPSQPMLSLLLQPQDAIPHTMAAFGQTSNENEPSHPGSSTHIASPPVIAVAPQTTVFQRQSSLSFTSEKDIMVHQEDVAGLGGHSHNLSKEDTTCDGGDKEKKRGVFDTRKKKIVMFCVALYWFICCCAYAMIAPFFPGEAKKKGANVTMVGLIFACFPLASFVFSPIVGVIIPIVGPKFVLLGGLIVEGGTQILFGFLHLMPDGTVFIVFCFLIRIVSALGSAATSTSCLTLLAQEFEDNLSPAVGIMETFGGFGMMAGPPIGAFLYSLGGFRLPFLTIGCLSLVSMLPLMYILPSDIRDPMEKASKGTLRRLIKIPAISVLAITIAVSGMTLSFLDPTLQEHLQKPFHLSTTKVGFIFLIAPGIYAFVAPVFGLIADKMDSRHVMSLGALTCGVSYILLGPAPFLPSKIFPIKLWLNCVALAILGLGIAPFLVPVLSDMNESAKRYGMAGDLATNSALSSIFNSMFNIGAIAGPTLGGILVEKIDFAWASAIFGLMLAAMALLIFVFTIYERRKIRRQSCIHEERKPLLA